MPKIKNKLFQPLLVLLEADKKLHLLPRQEIEVDRKDLESSHLQAFVERGEIALVDEERKPNTESPSRER